MDTQQKFNLITQGLQEVINGNILMKILQKRDLKVYFGTACTGKPHVGYLLSFIKIAHLLKAGCEVKVLIADLHAMLDSLKTTDKLLAARTQYYEVMIKAVLQALGVDLTKLSFVKGTDFQLQPEYTFDVYKLLSTTSLNRGIKAGADVVKQSTISREQIFDKVTNQLETIRTELDNDTQQTSWNLTKEDFVQVISETIRLHKQGTNPSLGSIVYPCLQALDEIHLKFDDGKGCDAELSGVDQRSIYTYSIESLRGIGYRRKGGYLMTPMLPAFSKGDSAVSNADVGKMSASSQDSKISFLDGKKSVRKKINTTFCRDGELEGSPLFPFLEHIVFPIMELKGIDMFVVNRPGEYGGDVSFKTFQEICEMFINDDINDRLSAIDLKAGIVNFVNKFLSNVKSFLPDNIQKISSQAY
jgi:tyrosyl-tRNA synthetase